MPTASPPVQSRFGGRAAVQASQRDQQEVVEQARLDMDRIAAVAGGIQEMRQPVVPRPEERIWRGQADRSHNRDGTIVGGPEYRAAKAARARRDEEAMAKRQSTERDFWEKNRAPVRSAESLLAEARNGLESLRVHQLRAIVLSRTGRLSKAKNNKDGAVLVEAKEAARQQPTSLIPPTPERPVVGSSVPEPDAAPPAVVSLTPCVTCPSCAKMVTLPPPHDDGRNFWCAECDGALSDAEPEGSDYSDGAELPPMAVTVMMMTWSCSPPAS